MFVRPRVRRAFLVGLVCLFMIGTAPHSGATSDQHHLGKRCFESFLASISRMLDISWKSITRAIEGEVGLKSGNIPPPDPDPEFGPWADPMG